MERCDFASVAAIIRKYLMEGSFESQSDFLFCLFDAYAEKTYAYFDNGQSNKWLNGLTKVSSAIGKFYYEDPENRNRLTETLRNKIMTRMPDSAMAVREIYELLIQDDSVSEREKKTLRGEYPDGKNADDAVFLTDVLMFGVVRRPFVARDIRKPALPSGNRSPALSGYIADEGLPNPCRHFRGRGAELDALHAMLIEKGKVFLCGIPGIGKSELAKAYAKTYRKDYTNILYLTYSGDLARDIADLSFSDDFSAESGQERLRRHNRFLRTLKPDTLLIIDNFNTSPDGDEFLSVIMKYRCRVLLTTRNNPPDGNRFVLEEIADADALFEICAELYADAEENRDILKEIIETVHGHTLAVELAARLLETGMPEPLEVLEKLRTEKASFDAADRISVLKDGKNRRATYYDHIHTLFALFNLIPARQEILRNLSLIPSSGIPARLFGKWMGFSDLNDINEMTELGFISPRPARKISLHPMMRDVSVSEFPPGIAACHTMLESVQNVCKDYAEEIPYSKMMFRTLENTVLMAEKDDTTFYLSLLEDAFQCMDKYRYENGMKLLLSEMDRLMEDDSVATPYHRTILLTFHAHMEKNPKKAAEMMREAVSAMPEISGENAALAACLNGDLANLYLREGNPEMVKKHLMATHAILNEFDLMGPDKMFTRLISKVALINKREDFDRAMFFLCEIERLLYNREDRAVLKILGGALKAMAYMDMATDHKERAVLGFQKALYVYAFLYADQPELLESEKQQIADICKSRELRGVFQLTNPV